MAETAPQANNLAIKFKKQKGLNLKEAHKRGLISDGALAKAMQKGKAK